MLWAAPATFILSALVPPASASTRPAGPSCSPTHLARACWASWGVLIPSRLLEGKSVDPERARGSTWSSACSSAGGLGAEQLGGVGPLSGWANATDPTFREVAGPIEALNPLGYAAYFGALYVLCGWPWVTARDRSPGATAPVAKAAALAGLVGMLWPSPQPWGLTVVALSAAVTQAVSPWSRQAADYARYVAASARRPRGRKVA
ncbi:MAG: hypothetical protein U0835_26080 [Isosphaeraceae bacterium]